MTKIKKLQFIPYIPKTTVGFLETTIFHVDDDSFQLVSMSGPNSKVNSENTKVVKVAVSFAPNLLKTFEDPRN